MKQFFSFNCHATDKNMKVNFNFQFYFLQQKKLFTDSLTTKNTDKQKKIHKIISIASIALEKKEKSESQRLVERLSLSGLGI